MLCWWRIPAAGSMAACRIRSSASPTFQSLRSTTAPPPRIAGCDGTTSTGTYMQERVSSSADGGKTWGTPVGVTRYPTITNQFFESIELVNRPTDRSAQHGSNGSLDPKANVNYDAFAAISKDGGATFGTNSRFYRVFKSVQRRVRHGFIGDYGQCLRGREKLSCRGPIRETARTRRTKWAA